MDGYLTFRRQAGLDPDEVRRMLDSDWYTDDVRKDELQARKQNIHMVPHFIIDGEQEISGAERLSQWGLSH